MSKRSEAMTAQQFGAALRKMNLSVYASAKVLGISLRQAQRYEAGETPIPSVVAKLVRAYVKHGVPD